MLQKIRKKTSVQNKKGAAVVEYGLLVGGVLLIALAAIAIFGHKTTDLMAATASVLPGAHEDDNAGIVSGKVIETTVGDAATPITLDYATIAANGGNARLADNLGVAAADLQALVVE